MRRLAAFVIALAACSSSDNTSPITPPPPPSTPASIRIKAGDAQQGAPGTALSVAIKVQVVDAAGQGVPGVTVTFHVDSGGGAIDVASTTSASDGMASAGTWHLGAAEGRNVLAASATGLAPVRFTATGVTGVVTIPSQTVGTSGGTFQVNVPASPLNGMKLEIPPGSFSAPLTVSITTAPATGLTLPAGVTAISPVITLRTSLGGYAEHPVYLTVPGIVPAGSFPALLMLDGTKVLEVMPTVTWNGTSVTAFTRHLDGSKLPTNGGASLRSGTEAEIKTVMVTIPIGLLRLTMNTGFVPGVDTWEFHPIATAFSPTIMAGMVATETWYFIYHHFPGTATDPPLWNRFQESPGIEFSNRRGIRWAAVAEQRVTDHLDAALKDVAAKYGVNSPAYMTYVSMLNIRTSLLIIDHKPVLTTLQSVNGGQVDYQVDAVAYASTYLPASAEDAILLATPVDPGHGFPVNVSVVGNGEVRMSLQFAGLPGTYTQMIAVGLSQSGDANDYADQYQRVLADVIGTGFFPTYELKSAWGTTADMVAPYDTRLYWLDPAYPKVLYADCTTCTGTPRPSTIPPGTPTIAGAVWHSTENGAPWHDFASGPVVVGKLADPGTLQLGAELYANSPTGELGWLDYRVLAVSRPVAQLLPLLPKTEANADLTLVLGTTGAPDGLDYVWNFGDGTTTTVTTTTQTHKWATAGMFTVEVIGRSHTTNEPILQSKTTVEVTPQKLAWRFTSLTKTGEFNHQTNLTYMTYFRDEFGNRNETDITKWYEDSVRFTPIIQQPSFGVIRQWLNPATGTHVMAIQYTPNGGEPNLAASPGGDVTVGFECYPAIAGMCTGAFDWYGLTISTNQDGSKSYAGHYVMTSTINATLSKDGKTFSGTFRIAEGGLPSHPMHYTDWAFQATKVP